MGKRQKDRGPKTIKNRVGFYKADLNRSVKGDVGILLFLLLVCSFMALPLVYSIVQSFKPPEEFFIFPPRFFRILNPTSNNYTMLFQLITNLRVPFIRYVFNTVFVTICSTGLCLIVGALAAYPFAKKEFYGKKMLWRLIMITLLFGAGVTSMPTYVVVSWLGLIDTYGVLIFPNIAVPIYLFLMRQFMLQIPEASLESARIDGAGEVQVFWKIIMPLIRPAWMTVMVLAFTQFWNTGSGNIFTESKKMFPTAIQQIGAATGSSVTGNISRQGVVAAATVLLMIPPIAIFVFNQARMMQTMAHSGIRE